MKKRIPTTEKLAKALEELNDPKLEDIIKRAREGHYDDYKTTIADPIMELVHDLRMGGHSHMAARAQAGEFDAQGWEGSEWFKDEGRRLLNESSLMRGKKKPRGTV